MNRLIIRAGNSNLAGHLPERQLSEPASNSTAAAAVGKLVAERAKEKGVEIVVFDRGGYIYHGRVKALAEAAREAGLKF